MDISNIIKKPNDKRFINLEGERFSNLYVVAYGGKWGKTKRKTHYWYCKCECGNETIAQGLHLKSGHTQSCGCLSVEKSTERISKFAGLKGEENPNYNPLLSDEEREKGRFLHKDKLNKWRADVFARDNYTCKHCCKTGGNLHAHHLDGYHWAKDKRFDVNNGVTLCEKCHRSFHKRFGFKNNTKEQFKNFATSNKSAN